MRWITALLTWFAAEPQAIDTEQPRAAACVCAARATLVQEVKHAKQNQDTATTVGKDDSGGQATKERRQQQTNSISSGLLLSPSSGMAGSCTDGSCVAVPTMRARVFRKR